MHGIPGGSYTVNFRVPEFHAVLVPADLRGIKRLIRDRPRSKPGDRRQGGSGGRSDIPGNLRIRRHHDDINVMDDRPRWGDRDKLRVLGREYACERIPFAVRDKGIEVALAVVDILVDIAVHEPVIIPQKVRVAVGRLVLFGVRLEVPGDPVGEVPVPEPPVSLRLTGPVGDREYVAEVRVG